MQVVVEAFGTLRRRHVDVPRAALVVAAQEIRHRLVVSGDQLLVVHEHARDERVLVGAPTLFDRHPGVRILPDDRDDLEVDRGCRNLRRSADEVGRHKIDALKVLVARQAERLRFDLALRRRKGQRSCRLHVVCFRVRQMRRQGELVERKGGNRREQKNGKVHVRSPPRQVQARMRTIRRPATDPLPWAPASVLPSAARTRAFCPRSARSDSPCEPVRW